MNTDKKHISDVYKYLKDYPSLIKEYKPHKLEAVIRHSKSIEEDLRKEFENLLKFHPEPPKEYEGDKLIIDYANEFNSNREYWLQNSTEGYLLTIEKEFQEWIKLYLDVQEIRKDIAKRKSRELSERKPDKTDKRIKHGEKNDIIKYWQENKATYLIDKYKFKSSGYYNKTKIAKEIKAAGGFDSHFSTIKDYTELKDL